MDKMITVEKTDEADWDEILPVLAVPIRAAESVKPSGGAVKTAEKVGGAIGAAFERRSEIAQINELLDERIRPYLASDGGWLKSSDSKNTRSKFATKARAAVVRQV